VKKILIGSIAGSLLLFHVPAFAETSGTADEVEFIFVETDTNGNGVIDRSEILADVIADFQTADTDQDGYIEKEEAGDQGASPEFADGDTDKDGKLSVDEAVVEKLSDFKSADTDSNGTLSIEEVRKTVTAAD
jgi:Ca2+-binding EF-hand superfamily protein